MRTLKWMHEQFHFVCCFWYCRRLYCGASLGLLFKDGLLSLKLVTTLLFPLQQSAEFDTFTNVLKYGFSCHFARGPHSLQQLEGRAPCLMWLFRICYTRAATRGGQSGNCRSPEIFKNVCICWSFCPPPHKKYQLVVGLCYTLPNQHIFRKYIIFSLLTNVFAAGWNGFAGRIGPAGCSLGTPGVEGESK